MQKDKKISRATIYRTLPLLIDSELIKRFYGRTAGHITNIYSGMGIMTIYFALNAEG